MNTLTRAYLIDDRKIDIWIEALLSCPFEVRFYVDEKKFDHKYKKYVRAIGFLASTYEKLDLIENLVSSICYTRGFIKNLSGRYPYDVRKGNQKVSGENNTSSGEHSEHVNESNHGHGEGESERIASKPDSDGDICLSDC